MKEKSTVGSTGRDVHASHSGLVGLGLLAVDWTLPYRTGTGMDVVGCLLHSRVQYRTKLQDPVLLTEHSKKPNHDVLSDTIQGQTWQCGTSNDKIGWAGMSDQSRPVASVCGNSRGQVSDFLLLSTAIRAPGRG